MAFLSESCSRFFPLFIRGRGVASSFIRRLHRKPSRVARQVALYISDILASNAHMGAGTIAALVNNLNAWSITAVLTCGHRRTDIGTAGPIVRACPRRTDITANAAVAGRDALLVLEGAAQRRGD